MKQLDFEHGTVTGNILGAALPMLVAQILNFCSTTLWTAFILHVSQKWEQQRWERWDSAFH